ncbi:MAG: chain length determinant protein tyrosine kinase EpsG [Gammaproteobacteria bacterium]|jgi:chain length determinant protein tyrosine kinase EpsG|nr:chain length determinant protein tyrosine kinase EpsG [Gammaproteobacteria bacterium]MBU1407269.1 chain length determinant protein tyrosine kinase EpsG [Gammaproteobacteria bacterium]MBU1531357.1 chain length determinant protein tyrosine kinase EpsG [Gammaproteobacteria bacterium]
MNSFTSTSEQDRIAEAVTSIRADANIGKLLQDAGKLKPQDMERVLKLQQAENLRFGEAALKLGLVSEADIQQALSHQFEYPYIPAAEASLSPELTAATAPYSKEAEALRSVRSELLLRWFKDGRKTLAIGSVRADEGASYLAANLAVLFAQMGRKVLLIDANMRQPRQQDIFNLGNGMGLSDILAERASSLQVHTIKPFHTLSVLPAGSPPPNPAELLARPAFGALLSGLETSYDIILIDTAPSQLTSDFQLVAARIGGMLIATRRNVSRVNPLAELKEKITLSGALVVGAVVLD